MPVLRPLLLLSCLLLPLHADETMNPFFAFAFGFKDWSPEEKINYLYEAGYDGIAPNVWNETLLNDYHNMLNHPLVESGAFRIYGVYFPYSFANREHRHLLTKVIRMGQAKDVPVWLAIKGDFEDAGEVDQLVREACREAEAVNLEVILYPHDRNHLLDVEDTLQLIDRLNEPNLYTSILSNHELRAHNTHRLDEIIAKSISRCRLAVISGADSPDQANTGSRDWSDVVQPLTGSDYDIKGFYDLLRQYGYRGPVGYMNFGIPGDPAPHHTASIALYRSWHD